MFNTPRIVPLLLLLLCAAGDWAAVEKLNKGKSKRGLVKDRCVFFSFVKPTRSCVPKPDDMKAAKEKLKHAIFLLLIPPHTHTQAAGGARGGGRGAGRRAGGGAGHSDDGAAGPDAGRGGLPELFGRGRLVPQEPTVVIN